MSQQAYPVTYTRFAEAIRELPLDTLTMKVQELQLSIIQLEYSIAEMLPFTVANATAPDQDCIEGIEENKVVIERQKHRIELVRTEVESRGIDWREFGIDEGRGVATLPGGNGVQDEHNDAPTEMRGERGSAWTDGTIQTGTISNGSVRITGADGRSATSPSSANGIAEDHELDSRGRHEDQATGEGLHL